MRTSASSRLSKITPTDCCPRTQPEHRSAASATSLYSAFTVLAHQRWRHARGTRRSAVLPRTSRDRAAITLWGLGKTKQLLERTLAARHPRVAAFLYLNILDPLVALVKHRSLKQPTPAAGVTADDKTVDFELDTAQWSMPRIAFLQLGASGGEDLQLQRRSNYQRLNAALQNHPHFRPLFAELPAGCCPLFFPLLTRNDQGGLRRHLIDASIECHGFGFSHPQIPEHEYAWERELKKSVCPYISPWTTRRSNTSFTPSTTGATMGKPITSGSSCPAIVQGSRPTTLAPGRRCDPRENPYSRLQRSANQDIPARVAPCPPATPV